MSAPRQLPAHIWAFEDDDGGVPRAGYWIDEQSETPEGSPQFTRTDLSQAAVAAALEAAASVLQSEADAGEKLDRAYLEGVVTLEMVHGWLRRYANSIRALITQRDHDALAAHVAAEVAKALEHAVSVIDAHAEYDRRLCCDGHMCGCQAATVHDEMKHYIRDYANDAAQIGAKP